MSSYTTLSQRHHPTSTNPVSQTYTARDYAEAALQANRDHQYALKVYTERLQAELDAVDKLIVSSLLCLLILLTNIMV